MLLYGRGDEAIEFSYQRAAAAGRAERHPFEGILPNLERRYRETESPAMREELGRYLTAACPACEGTRLRREARFVYVGGRSARRASRI